MELTLNNLRTGWMYFFLGVIIGMLVIPGFHGLSSIGSPPPVTFPTKVTLARGKIPSDFKEEAIRNALEPCWNYLQNTPSARRSLSAWDNMVTRNPNLMASLNGITRNVMHFHEAERKEMYKKFLAGCYSTGLNYYFDVTR